MFMPKNVLPGDEHVIDLLENWSKEKILEKYPDYQLRSKNEKGQPNDKLILQTYRGRNLFEIENYNDFQKVMRKWEKDEKYQLPEKKEFDSNAGKGQWYFRVNLIGSKYYRLFRTMRWAKSK